MGSMYSRRTWAQQQGSGRVVTRIIVYNPISTSLRLLIDPWDGWGVFSALAFESGQWSRERRERKEKKATAGYAFLNSPRNVCLHSAIYVGQKNLIWISHTHQILSPILLQYQHKPPSSQSHHLCEKWENSNSSGEKNQDFFRPLIYCLPTHTYFWPFFFPPLTSPHKPGNHTRFFLSNSLSPQNTRQPHISYLPCTTSEIEHPWGGSDITTARLCKSNNSLHPSRRCGRNGVDGWSNQSLMSTSSPYPVFSHVHTFWQVPYPISGISFANQYIKKWNKHQTQYAQTSSSE